MALVGEAESIGNLCNTKFLILQQALGFLNSQMKDVLVRGYSGALLERPAEMERTHLDQVGEVLKTTMLGKVRGDVIDNSAYLVFG